MNKYIFYIISILVLLVKMNLEEISYIYHSNFHEKQTSQFLDNYCSNNPIDWVLDAGAYLGDTCISLALKHQKVNILAIEPDIKNCQFIKKKCKLHGINNITILSNGLSNLNDQYIYTDFRNLFPQKIYKLTNQERKNSIKTKTIDYFHKMYNINLIHLDVESFEYQVLQGAKNIIKDRKCTFIIEILFKNRDKDSIINTFKSEGYSIYYIPEYVCFPYVPCGYNYIFAPVNTNFLQRCTITKSIIKLF